MERIQIYRHGDKTSYDANGKQLNSGIWEVVEEFDCVEAVMLSDENTQAYATEQERRSKRFYIEVRQQRHTVNFDIRIGDYIFEPDCRGYCWKLLSVVEQEITCGCWYIILTGEELTQREQLKLRIQDVTG